MTSTLDRAKLDQTKTSVAKGQRKERNELQVRQRLVYVENMFATAS